jgi:ABC-type Na+ efflux pump permease subunit
VFRIFSYGLTTVLLLLAPAFPATSLITERQRGTLALLINSPLGPWSIYLGKLSGVLGFALILLALSLPASAACCCTPFCSWRRWSAVPWASW